MARALPPFFTAQAERVVARFERHNAKAFGDAMLPDSEDAMLWTLIASIEVGVIQSVGQIAADMVGGQPFTGRTDPRLQTLLGESGQRIRNINETTRQAVQETILEGYGRGYSDYQIANGVETDGFRGLRAIVTEIYEGRAEAIAITEVAHASELAAHDRYDAAGIHYIEWLDGPECGVDKHGEPPYANGMIVPMHFASAHVSAHPRCRRVSLPWSPTLANQVPVRVPLPAIVGAA